MKKILYGIYSWCIALPIFVVWTIFVTLTVTVAAILGDQNFIPCYLPHLWGKFTCLLCLHKIKLSGFHNLDPKQSYVFIANHQGYFDIFLVYGFLPHPFKWMMKEYLRKLPFVGLAAARSKQIFVGESRASITHAVRLAEETLKDGMSLCIFPEGTRTHDGRMNEFKRGAFMLASNIGLPIVPITVNGSFDVFSRNDFQVHQGTLELIVHDPIMPEEYKKIPSKDFMAQVYDIIHQDLDEKYK